MASTITVGVLRALLTLDQAQYTMGLREATSSLKAFETQNKRFTDNIVAGMSEAGKAASASGKMIAGMGDAGRQAAAALGPATMSLKELQTQAQKVGSALTGIGSVLTASVTVPIVAAFGGAAKAAIDFESSFAGVRKTVDASEADFKVLEQQFRDLAKTIPINVNEINRLGEAAGALGIPKDKIVDFTRVMAELGVTTNVTSEQAANDIAKIQNIFGASGQATENFASTLVDLGNKGASTEQEILALATRIASAGNTVGLTQSQVLGFAAAIANVGMEAEAGGSAMSRVLNEISSAVSAGGKDLAKFAQVAGMASQQFAQLFRDDAAAATQKFIEGLGRIKQAGGDLNGTLAALGFTELRQSDLLRRLAGDATGVGTALQTASAAWQQNTALSAEAEKRFATLASQAALLWAAIRDVGITIGQALVPFMKAALEVFKAITPFIETAANLFAKLPIPVQAVGLGLLGMAAAAGPLLVILGQLAFAVSSLAGIGGLSGLATTLGGLVGGSGVLTVFGTALGAVKAAVVGLMGPWGLLAIAVGAIVAVLWNVAGGWDGIKAALAPVGALLSDVGVVLGDLATRFLRWVVDGLKDFWQWLTSVAGSLKKYYDAVSETIGPLKEFIDNLWRLTPAGMAFTVLEKTAGVALKNVREDIHETAEAIRTLQGALAAIEPDHQKMQQSWKDSLKQFEAKPITLGLELEEKFMKRPVVPKLFGGGSDKEAEKARKAAEREADRAMKDQQAAIKSIQDMREDLRASSFKITQGILKEERAAAEKTADAWLKSFNAQTAAKQELAKTIRAQEFEQAEFTIEQAKRQGASWQQIYAMERQLSEAKLQAAIDDAEREFQIRTAGIDRTTAHGEAEYQALKAVHDATIDGMVANHSRAEALKRDELDKTHNVWRKSMDALRELWAGLTKTIADNLTAALMHATSFKDAFVGIWQSIKQSLLSIFGDILNSFIKTVLDGAIGAIMGRQGAFSQAFGSLFGGGGGGVGGLLGNGGGLLGGLLGGGAANSSVAAVLAGNAGIASATTAGMAATGAGAAGAAGAGGGAAAAGGAGGGLGSLGAFLTNPWTIGIAGAILGGVALWKSGVFRGGEEGTQVNPARDAFFGEFQRQYGGTQFEAMAKAFAEHGVSGDIAERLIRQLYDADTMKEFEAATKAITEALSAAENKLQATQHAITLLSTTAEALGRQGTVSSDVMAALQTAIRGLSTTGSVEQIRMFNVQLMQLLQSGTATNESVAALTAQIVALGDQAAQVDTPDLEASAQAVDRVNDALTQFNATIDHLQSMGTVGEEAINALRKQIADLSQTTDPEVIQRLNDTLTRMIEEGTATDETIQVLADTVEMMSRQNTQTTTTTDDLTDASSDLEKQFDRNCWISNEMRQRLAELEAQTGSVKEAWARLIEEMMRPIDVHVNVPTIDLGDYISGGSGGMEESGGMVPSFATEGIARAPMLAMVGDAGPGNPEWILHQSTLGAALQQSFAFGSAFGSMQSDLQASSAAVVDQPRSDRVIVGGESFINNGPITLVANDPQSFVTQFKQMLRHDHASVVALRKVTA